MTKVDLTHIPPDKLYNSLTQIDLSSPDTKESSSPINSSQFLDEELNSFLSSSNSKDLFPTTIAYANQQIPPQQTQPPNTPLTHSSLLKFSEQSTTLIFEPNTIVYDINFIGNLLVVTGGKYIKVYDIDNNYDLISSYFIPNENLYCLSLTTINNETPIAAVGGQGLTIRIINLTDSKEMNQLIGHKNEIYDLKFHPNEHILLLSASKDSSIRLWNVLTKDQLCIFGGPLGHNAEVLSIDWHCSGDYFASSGIDNTVKIWKINTPKIKAKITQNMKNNNEFKQTLIKTSPFFTCNTIHDNYIDSIKFNGNFIISKSVDGIVKEWLPLFNKEGDLFYIINTFHYMTKDKIWYVKLTYIDTLNTILVGNENGKVFLFCNDDVDSDKTNDVFDTKTDTVIRAICYSSEYNLCAFASNQGEVVLTSIIEMNNHVEDINETIVTKMNI